MAATSNNYKEFKSLSLADRYKSLNDNLNLLNNRFEQALHQRESLTQEGNIQNGLKVIHHALSLVAKGMNELVNK